MGLRNILTMSLDARSAVAESLMLMDLTRLRSRPSSGGRGRFLKQTAWRKSKNAARKARKRQGGSGGFGRPQSENMTMRHKIPKVICSTGFLLLRRDLGRARDPAYSAGYLAPTAGAANSTYRHLEEFHFPYGCLRTVGRLTTSLHGRFRPFFSSFVRTPSLRHPPISFTLPWHRSHSKSLRPPMPHCGGPWLDSTPETVVLCLRLTSTASSGSKSALSTFKMFAPASFFSWRFCIAHGCAGGVVVVSLLLRVEH